MYKLKSIYFLFRVLWSFGPLQQRLTTEFSSEKMEHRKASFGHHSLGTDLNGARTDLSALSKRSVEHKQQLKKQMVTKHSREFQQLKRLTEELSKCQIHSFRSNWETALHNASCSDIDSSGEPCLKCRFWD